MKTLASLTGSNLRTYQTIFQHPASHNLGWRDVHALFAQIALVEPQANGNLKVTRNGQTLVLHPPRTKDVAETEELMALRHFLKLSEEAPTTSGSEPRWLLLIDHRQARLFRTEMIGVVDETILPHEPSEYFRHEKNSENVSRGQEKPDPNTYFTPVAKALGEVGPILVFGSGTGKSSEMDRFVAWLTSHHPQTAARVIGSVVVDGHHQTDGQLLARAREFYAHHRGARA